MSSTKMINIHQESLTFIYIYIYIYIYILYIKSIVGAGKARLIEAVLTQC